MLPYGWILPAADYIGKIFKGHDSVEKFLVGHNIIFLKIGFRRNSPEMKHHR
jgi:hypothetical protein